MLPCDTIVFNLQCFEQCKYVRKQKDSIQFYVILLEALSVHRLHTHAINNCAIKANVECARFDMVAPASNVDVANPHYCGSTQLVMN